MGTTDSLRLNNFVLKELFLCGSWQLQLSFLESIMLSMGKPFVQGILTISGMESCYTSLGCVPIPKLCYWQELRQRVWPGLCYAAANSNNLTPTETLWTGTPHPQAQWGQRA